MSEREAERAARVNERADNKEDADGYEEENMAVSVPKNTSPASLLRGRGKSASSVKPAPEIGSASSTDSLATSTASTTDEIIDGDEEETDEPDTVTEVDSASSSESTIETESSSTTVGA